MCFLLIEKVVGQAEKGDAGGITPSETGSRVAPEAIGEFVAIHLEERGGGQVGIAHFQKPSEVSQPNDVDCHLCCQEV
ncbi:hypothetical protein J2W35_004770 [Variovorax boronicumulans]|uniref:hypothetical protein n=1 Tax=Variovorax boronicumulans TaxID=436515 RepID=UPI0027849D86|nr:hypothetical protein [Variovorax boronicumulans]MDQ0084401.1 hypothetical protein [Variovorax boronicumulans]